MKPTRLDANEVVSDVKPLEVSAFGGGLFAGFVAASFWASSRSLESLAHVGDILGGVATTMALGLAAYAAWNFLNQEKARRVDELRANAAERIFEVAHKLEVVASQLMASLRIAVARGTPVPKQFVDDAKAALEDVQDVKALARLHELGAMPQALENAADAAARLITRCSRARSELEQQVQQAKRITRVPEVVTDPAALGELESAVANVGAVAKAVIYP